MTTPYDVYNEVNVLMCTFCNQSIRKKCNLQDEDARCKTKMKCMRAILKRDDEEYPTTLPKVKKYDTKEVHT